MDTITFAQYVSGNLSIGVMLGGIFMAAIGVVISLLIESSMRKPLKSGSPVEFSWKYLFKDNWKRIVLSFLLVLVTIRFAPDILGKEPGPFLTLGIGLVWDQLAGILKKKLPFIQVLMEAKEGQEPLA